MSKLLINEPPLLVLPSLAQAIGLNEAIALQQIHYWLDPRLNKNFQENKYWVYNSYDEWQRQFPFWSLRTIRRTIQSLEDKKLLFSRNFCNNSFDKTKWYTINYSALNALKPNENPYGQNGHIDVAKMDSSMRPEWPDRCGQNGQLDMANLATSYIDTENTTENTTDISLLINSKKSNNSLIIAKEREMLKIWNELIETKLGREIQLTLNRKNLLKKRLSNFFDDDLLKWSEFCKKIIQSSFLMGEKTDFRVQLDWILDESNLVKVLEGTYNREAKKDNTQIDKNLIKDSLTNEIMKENSPEFWKEIMLDLITKKGVDIYNSWFKQNKFDSLDDGILQMRVPNKFFAKWQTDNFLEDLINICKSKVVNFKELKIIY